MERSTSIEVYYNALENIWLICHFCNNQKGAKDWSQWFKENEFYGQEFLEEIGGIQQGNGTILAKTDKGRSLADAALDWFWEHYEQYIANKKRLIQEVINPLEKRNEEIKHLPEGEEKQEKQAEFEAVIAIESAVAKSDLGGASLTAQSNSGDMRTQLYSLMKEKVQENPNYAVQAIAEKVLANKRELPEEIEELSKGQDEEKPQAKRRR